MRDALLPPTVANMLPSVLGAGGRTGSGSGLNQGAGGAVNAAGGVTSSSICKTGGA